MFVSWQEQILKLDKDFRNLGCNGEAATQICSFQDYERLCSTLKLQCYKYAGVSAENLGMTDLFKVPP